MSKKVTKQRTENREFVRHHVFGISYQFPPHLGGVGVILAVVGHLLGTDVSTGQAGEVQGLGARGRLLVSIKTKLGKNARANKRTLYYTPRHKSR